MLFEIRRICVLAIPHIVLSDLVAVSHFFVLSALFCLKNLNAQLFSRFQQQFFIALLCCHKLIEHVCTIAEITAQGMVPIAKLFDFGCKLFIKS